jgi:hypothetical protein
MAKEQTWRTKMQCGAYGNKSDGLVYRAGIDLYVCSTCNEIRGLGSRLVDMILEQLGADEERAKPDYECK